MRGGIWRKDFNPVGMSVDDLEKLKLEDGIWTPYRGQFQIYYRSGTGEQEYQPDFVAEGADCIFMLEPKARNQLQTAEVIAKKAAAIRWCENASAYSKSYNGKPWVYLLLPHDIIAENMTMEGLKNWAA